MTRRSDYGTPSQSHHPKTLPENLCLALPKTEGQQTRKRVCTQGDRRARAPDHTPTSISVFFYVVLRIVIVKPRPQPLLLLVCARTMRDKIQRRGDQDVLYVLCKIRYLHGVRCALFISAAVFHSDRGLSEPPRALPHPNGGFVRQSVSRLEIESLMIGYYCRPIC
jgi:hypothetical protein